MKLKVSLILVALFISTTGFTQALSKAVFKISSFKTETFSTLSFGNVIIEVNESGEIKSFNTISGGDFDYWEGFSGSEKLGKVKSIEGNSQSIYALVQ